MLSLKEKVLQGGVLCESKEELESFLRLLEKETDLVWVDGKNPLGNLKEIDTPCVLEESWFYDGDMVFSSRKVDTSEYEFTAKKLLGENTELVKVERDLLRRMEHEGLRIIVDNQEQETDLMEVFEEIYSNCRWFAGEKPTEYKSRIDSKHTIDYTFGSLTHGSSFNAPNIIHFDDLDIDFKSFPQKGDDYYTVSLSSSGSVIGHTFDDDDFDKSVLETGNVFKTKQEAQEKLDKIMEVLKS